MSPLNGHSASAADRVGDDLWAEGEPAQQTAQAIAYLLDAERKRSLTTQWMPDGRGCRFEVIQATGDRIGEYLAAVFVAEDGTAVLRFPCRVCDFDGTCGDPPGEDCHS